MIYEDVSMDTQYMDAVKRGNEEIFQKMLNGAAIKRGYNSPIVYHGTHDSSFNIFNTKKEVKSGIFGVGVYFTQNYNSAKGYIGSSGDLENGGRVVSVKLKLKNPLIFKTSDYDSSHSQMLNAIGLSPQDSGDKITKRVLEMGYDSVILMSMGDFQEVVVYEPNQIKLADPVTYDDNEEIIPLSQRFDSNNDDIRY